MVSSRVLLSSFSLLWLSGSYFGAVPKRTAKPPPLLKVIPTTIPAGKNLMMYWQNMGSNTRLAKVTVIRSYPFMLSRNREFEKKKAVELEQQTAPVELPGSSDRE